MKKNLTIAFTLLFVAFVAIAAKPSGLTHFTSLWIGDKTDTADVTPGNNDLFVSGTAEFDGAVRIDGGLTATTLSMTTITLANGLTIDNATNNIMEWNENSEEIKWTFSSNELDLSSTTGVMTFSLLDNSAATLTHAADGAAEDFTISQTGANDSSLILTSAGTGADASSLLATAGGVTITGATDVVVGATADDVTITAEDDLTLNGGSAGSIITIGGNTEGNTVNIATDDTTADTINIGSAKDTVNIVGAMTMTAGGGTAATGVAAVETAPVVRTVTLTLTLTGANDIDVGDGGKTAGVKIYDFPEGRIAILGATADLSVTANDVWNDTANDIYYMSVGTADGTQAADADLTTTEQDVIAKTTIDTDSGDDLTDPIQGGMSTFGTDNLIDGTTTAAALYVNVAVPDASNTGASTHAVTGTLTVTYVNLGDY